MKSEHLSEVSLRLTRLLRLGGLAGDSKLGKKNQGQKGWAKVTCLIGGWWTLCKDAKNGDAFLGGQFI